MPISLRLLARLIDVNRHLQRFAAAAIARAAHRRGAEIIEPDRDPHMGVGGGNPVGRVEADPAEVLDIGFRPGMAGLLRGDAVGAVEMAADIARRDAELARRRDEDVGEVLADAALEREGFGRGGRGMGRIGVEGDLAIERVQQRVQQRQRVAACAGARACSRRNRRSRRRLA